MVPVPISCNRAAHHITAKRFATVKQIALAAAMFLATTTTAAAQQAVELTRELLNETWAVIEVKGNAAEGDVATISFAEELAQGSTPCVVPWTAQYKINLPAVQIWDVQAPAYNCPAARRTSEFLLILEDVRSARTSSEGLELIGPDGKRLMLLTAGG